MLLLCLFIFSILLSEKVAADSVTVEPVAPIEEISDSVTGVPDAPEQITDSTPVLPDDKSDKKDITSIPKRRINYVDVPKVAVEEDEIQDDNESFLIKIIEAGIIFILSIILIIIVNAFFKHLSKSMTLYGKEKFKAIKIKRYQILDQNQILHGVLLCLNGVKYTLILLILFLTVPLIFRIFPQTHDFAITFWGYFLSPIKVIFFGIINYIPRLITIVIILFVIRYILKMLKFFTNEIDQGRLTIKGFYPDWAKPTFVLLRCLIYIFTIALIYPHLPYADTRVFQGVSVFVGILISLGSSTAIGNLIAGLMITYMRPFKIGDRIKIGENVGMVIERNAVVVKIETDKKEFVTFPNLTILTSSITNFSSSSQSANGLVIHTNVTYSYDVDWRKIHELLITAAKNTLYIEKTPEPFVLQKALDDFYCVYEINAYTKEVEKVTRIYSELHQNIQDIFSQAGLDLTAPHYEIYTEKK
jgi:small-conductance mechanosensitive channel